MSASCTPSTRCPYCHKKTAVVIRHIHQDPACRLRWEADAVCSGRSPGNNDVSPMDLYDELTMENVDDVGPDTLSPEESTGHESRTSENAPGHAAANKKYVLEYPGPAGQPKYKTKTAFESTFEYNKRHGYTPWAPFVDKDEWELVEWILKNLGQGQTDEFLRLDTIKRHTLCPTFHNNYSFMKKLDSLPCGPGWTCEMVRLPSGPGGVEHEDELWLRNINECIAQLLGNPAFRDHISYKPCKVFTDQDMTMREYGELWTADWWWETQEKLPRGATVAPVILSTDETHLTSFKGDKTAWPVYLSLGNISKCLRRQPSTFSTVLIGYLPVSELEWVSKDNRSWERYRLFHYCMRRILHPMQDAGRSGMDVCCGDGMTRNVFPILASYIADHPEQCLVACCKKSRCPRCVVAHDERQDLYDFPSRDQASFIAALREYEIGKPQSFDALGLRPIYQPFWADLPLCDIFICFTPDILHQLHIGVFHSHLVDWCTRLIGKEELDARFKAVPGHPGLRHFKHGISRVSQWTGKEHKAMEKVFLAIISSAVDKRVVLLARAMVDFIYYAQLHSHTDRTLAALDDSLAAFHANKDVIVNLGIRKHFNIPKLHAISHYGNSIRSHGSLDGYNAEGSERLHIDYAKHAYRSTNRRDYVIQMVKWLQRREAVRIRSSFIAWCDGRTVTDGKDDDDFHTQDDCEVTHIHSMDSSKSYRIAVNPPYPHLTSQEIERLYNVTGFLPALTIFIRTRLRTVSVSPSAHHRFDCYSQITVFSTQSPRLSSPTLLGSCIRACPPRVSGNPREVGVHPGQFDNAFVIETPDGVGIPSVRIARVRLIFWLPVHLGHAPHPLALIEWYTPLGPIDSTTGMYHVTRATRNRRPHSEVVCVTQLIRGCHLIPQFPSRVDPTWDSNTSLDRGSRFFINHYIDVSTFVLSKNM